MAEWVPNKYKLIRGEDSHPVFVILDNERAPVNLSGISAIFLRIKNEDNSVLEKAADGGFSASYYTPVYFYTFALTAAETLAFPLGLSNVTIKLVYGVDRHRYLNYVGAFDISDKQI